MSSDSESDDDSLSPENGFRCVPEPSVDLEELLLAVGEIVGCENIVSASDWDDGVAVFLKHKDLVNKLIESGIFLHDVFMEVMPFIQPDLANDASDALVSEANNYVEEGESLCSGEFRIRLDFPR